MGGTGRKLAPRTWAVSVAGRWAGEENAGGLNVSTFLAGERRDDAGGPHLAVSELQSARVKFSPQELSRLGWPPPFT